MSKAVIFDFDGVLVDSVEFWFRINQTAAKALEKNLSKGVYLESFSGNIHLGLAENLKLKAKEMEKFFRIKHQLVDKFYNRRGLKFFSFVKGFIPRLYKQADLYIVTSSPKKAVRSLLARQGLNRYFKQIYGLNRKGKRLVLSRLAKKYSAKNIIFVTDTIGDIKEGRAAGLKVCSVAWGFHKKKQLMAQKPDILVSNFAQLSKLLLKYAQL